MSNTEQIQPATNQPANQSTHPSINYTLHLADSALILSQRNSEWCGHGPVLEQDIAITNISLDLLGQARNFYQYAAALINASAHQPVTEDSLAYLRTEREFKNYLLAELPRGDWGQTVMRQFFISQFQYLLYDFLQHTDDTEIAAIAAKALKEVSYHLRWSSEWVIRLGDGTEESRDRMLAALDFLLPYTGELFMPASYEKQLQGTALAPDLSVLQKEWQQKVAAVLQEASLPLPAWDTVFMHNGGKEGIHTENLGYILTDLQYLQRTYPGCEW